MLAARGAQVIDGDRVYRDLLQPGSPLMTRLVDRFGNEIVSPSGEIDRKALGQIVFNDASALADLDALTHPAIVEAMRRQIALSTSPAVVVEAVKLAHTDLIHDIDALWLVTADQDIRRERLIARSGLDAEHAQARIDAFSDPIPTGVPVDAIIDNSGTIDALAPQVIAAWNAFQASGAAAGHERDSTTREDS